MFPDDSAVSKLVALSFSVFPVAVFSLVMGCPPFQTKPSFTNNFKGESGRLAFFPRDREIMPEPIPYNRFA
jgi:hypothetical protein